ncbi:MAG TPA: hypothetical protein PLP11_01785 [Bacteroidales bacterium]|nr:hypothetical protein [Bacteroidales bacterium]HQP03310.1 hypothetical protein [Bacteroidales bacterium]
METQIQENEPKNKKWYQGGTVPFIIMLVVLVGAMVVLGIVL